MKVCIIRYNAGNTESVKNALLRIGAEPEISDEPEVIAQADKVIFPGVGEASTAMNYLRKRKLDELILGLRQPVLGICLGMQLLCSHSEENDTKLLGLLDTRVEKFDETKERVPHVGWNKLTDLKGELFNGIDDGEHVYFVHSYYVPPIEESIGNTEYGCKFTSALQYKNFYGVQFHCEKSGSVGERILGNFLKL